MFYLYKDDKTTERFVDQTLMIVLF